MPRRRPDVPFEPKGEYAPGAEILWEEGGDVHVGQVWAVGPAMSGNPVVWVIPFEPIAGEYAVKIVRGRKGGGRIGGGAFVSGQLIAEGEARAVQRVYAQHEYARAA